MQRKKHASGRNRFFYDKLVPLVFVFIFFPMGVSAATVTLIWDKSTGIDIAGYRVFCRKASQNYNYDNPAWDGRENRCTISGLDNYTDSFFVVRAYSSSGIESGDSNEAHYQPEPYDASIGKDTDGDGMPDTWEAQYGLNPLFDDASEDLDGDGICNINEYFAGSDPTRFTANDEPYPPVLSSPYNGECVALTPELGTEPFSDPDHGDLHGQTEWQIRRKSDNLCVFNVTSCSFLTSIRVPTLILEEDTSYYWMARFYDRYGAASDWSDSCSFTTAYTGRDTDGNGIPDGQEIDVAIDLDANGTPDIYQEKIKCVNTVNGNGQIGISFEDSPTIGSIEFMESADFDSISDTYNKPDYMPLGMINFKLKVNQPGDRADVTVYFSESAPANARWFKYELINGWQDFSQHARFGPDGKSVILTLEDGGPGDADGIANGVILDPSGFDTSSSCDSDSASASFTGNSSGGGGGCFITTAACGSSISSDVNRPRKFSGGFSFKWMHLFLNLSGVLAVVFLKKKLRHHETKPGPNISSSMK